MKISKNEFLNELKKIYTAKGILNVNLRTSCPNSENCWQDMGDDRKVNSDYDLYTPYIGENFSESRIMVVAINMNGEGGAEAVDYLAGCAIEEISAGKKKTFAKPYDTPPYPGSLLWHRLLSHSVFVLREKGILPIPDGRPYPTISEMEEAMKYIAVTNSIKCSPDGDNSAPSYQMWQNCPSLILLEEIKVLKPKFIIMLGVENFNHFTNLISINKIDEIEYTSLNKGTYNNEEFLVINIPHPASSQGSAYKRMAELEELMMRYYNHKS